MMRIAYLFVLLILLAPSLQGQVRFEAGQNDYVDGNKGVVYNKEFTVDVKLHTNGFALGVNIGRLKSYYHTRFFNIELGEIKHPKEFRQSFDFQVPNTSKVSRAFIFGKQNNFLVLRGGVGEKRYFSEKDKRRGLAVGVSYEVGPSLGFLKPYYLELIHILGPDSEETNRDYEIRSEKFSEENADLFLGINSIYGSSGFTKGLSELSLMPGAHAKFAVHFDWGAFDEFVKAVEAGVMVDVYARKVPIMVESELVTDAENRPFFVNLYLNLQLGKRW